MDGLKRRGDLHVSTYGAIRRTHNQALRHLMEDNKDNEEKEENDYAFGHV